MNKKKLLIPLVILIVIVLSVFLWYLFRSNASSRPVRVGISNGFIGNNWRNQMMEDLHEAIALYQQSGIISEVIIKNAGEDVNNQILQIRHLINSNVDLLLINPNSSDELNEVIAQASQKGILVVVYDQNTTSPHAVQMTIDQYEYGIKLAEWIVESLDAQGNIIMMSGVENQPCNTLRVAGMNSVLSKHPNINVLEEVHGNWDQATARKVMTDVLSRHSDINGVLSQDGMALGIIQAYEAAGRQLPLMCGETMNAYMEKSIVLSAETDFKTFALTNPPGIGASALSLGLWLINNYEDPLSSPVREYYFPVRDMLIENGKLLAEFKYSGGMGTVYFDEWYVVNEIETHYGEFNSQ